VVLRRGDVFSESIGRSETWRAYLYKEGGSEGGVSGETKKTEQCSRRRRVAGESYTRYLLEGKKMRHVDYSLTG